MLGKQKPVFETWGMRCVVALFAVFSASWLFLIGFGLVGSLREVSTVAAFIRTLLMLILVVAWVIIWWRIGIQTYRRTKNDENCS